MLPGGTKPMSGADVAIITAAMLLAICAAAKIVTAKNFLAVTIAKPYLGKKTPLAIAIVATLAFCAGMSALIVDIGRKALEYPIAH